MSSTESRVAVARPQGLGLEADAVLAETATMEKDCKSAKGGGRKPTAAWSRQEVLDQAAQYLAAGGVEARRELVRTLIGLDRLLGRQA